MIRIKIGCCGWGYFRAKDFHGADWRAKYKSVLQAYAALFPTVEINSTFYRIPKLQTAEKWREQADAVNKKFEFSVKCNQMVTHRIRFGKASVAVFKRMKDICKALRARIMLLQSPASFKPTKENITRMADFFAGINRRGLVLVWEPRGQWHSQPEQIKKVCKKFKLIECVDPFRNELLCTGKEKIAYFRLHGFGLTSMYNYKFSKIELNELKEKIKALKGIKSVYTMFNNRYMYENALQFAKIMEK